MDEDGKEIYLSRIYEAVDEICTALELTRRFCYVRPASFQFNGCDTTFPVRLPASHAVTKLALERVVGLVVRPVNTLGIFRE